MPKVNVNVEGTLEEIEVMLKRLNLHPTMNIEFKVREVDAVKEAAESKVAPKPTPRDNLPAAPKAEEPKPKAEEPKPEPKPKAEESKPEPEAPKPETPKRAPRAVKPLDTSIRAPNVAAPKPAKEPEAAVEGLPAGLSMEKLQAATKLKDVLRLILDAGHKDQALAICKQLREKLPVLQRVPNLDERIPTALELLDD